MKIRKFKLSDSREVGKIIAKTFKKYNKSEGSKKAVESYVNIYNTSNLDKLKSNFRKSDIFYLMEDKRKVIGMIRGNKNRMGNLYVFGKYHNKGIGKKLVERFEKEAKKQSSKFIKIKASLYAIPFYKKLGYKKTTGIKKIKFLFNLKYQPMIKILK